MYANLIPVTAFPVVIAGSIVGVVIESGEPELETEQLAVAGHTLPPACPEHEPLPPVHVCVWDDCAVPHVVGHVDVYAHEPVCWVFATQPVPFHVYEEEQIYVHAPPEVL